MTYLYSVQFCSVYLLQLHLLEDSSHMCVKKKQVTSLENIHSKYIILLVGARTHEIFYLLVFYHQVN